jgi:hypothetical protein
MRGARPVAGAVRRPFDMQGSEGEAVSEPGPGAPASGGAAGFAPAEAEAPRPPRALRALAALTAPLGASRLLFPSRFSRAVERVSRDPFARSVPTIHARRFFGEGLILRVDPAHLAFRLIEDVSDGRAARRLGFRFLEGGD